MKLNPLLRIGAHSRRALAAAIILTLPSCALADGIKDESSTKDEWTNSGTIEPRDNAEERFASPLRVVTLVTDDLAHANHFFSSGLGLTMSPIVQLSEEDKRAFTQAFDLSSLGDWEMYYAHRPSTDDEVAVRIIHATNPTPALRRDMNARSDGILAMGSAIDNLDHHEPFMTNLGIGSVAGIQTLENLPLPQGGGTYDVREIHYAGPESAYFLGIDRPEGVKPISTIDPIVGVGGPTYSSAMAEDPTEMVEFLKLLLGYETRRELTFKINGAENGLHLTPQVPVKFLQLFAPGAPNGWVIIMGVGEDRVAPPAQPRPPSRGLGAWTFSVPDMEEAVARLDEMNVSYTGPLAIADPIMGSRRMITTVAPNGQLIELVEPTASTISFAQVSQNQPCDAPVLMLVEGVNEDPDQFAVYGEKLSEADLYRQTDGYYLSIGDPAIMFEGVWSEPEFRVLARFPCERKAREFWNSPKYREIFQLRKDAGSVRVAVFPELPAPEYAAWVSSSNSE